ncbi:hypothetical protein NIES4071_02430 [Calothrix sp. NIES-4071]|nr:hypothetical protein NIES4071_02430 [Calothrix sp. NIES-4071]BAZ54589.1 hypothetical protein NIES4105_02420 [Calothrix sp. NIES-4105]
MTNHAIVIGINSYDYLNPLKYAKRDAQEIQKFLYNEVKFEEVLLFSDDSPQINGESTRPNRANLRRVLLKKFNNPFMRPGDNFWFFFAGHGIRHNDRDYLMPSDGNPLDIEETAISVNFVTERLRRCGADNVVLILDACRNQGSRFGRGIGEQTVEVARQLGIISIFSCSPNEFCYEFDQLQQGAFTYALLEALGTEGKCATVECLNEYLRRRVPEIVRKYDNNVQQTPYISAEPVNKLHLILIPKYATHTDIATLKTDAYRAKEEGDINLADQLWRRVITVGSSEDREEAINMLQKIAVICSQDTSPPLDATQNSGTQNYISNIITIERGLDSEAPTSEPLLVSKDSFNSKKLSEQQLQKLQDTLIDAFDTKSSLAQLLSSLSLELNKNLDNIANDNLATFALNLIKTADAQGWIENLIYVARELNLENSKLRNIAQELLTYQSKQTQVSDIIEQKILERQKILILITIPHHWLLDKEIKKIEEVIQKATNQDLFEICIRTAVCPQDIHQVIKEEQPQIVHLCGHGIKDGRLLLEDDEGNNKPISPENLASFFDSHNDTIKCVLLNACYSQLLAEAISQHIHYVIGMNQSIKDKAAILFTQKFYETLGSKTQKKQDVFQKAFDESLNMIQLENCSQESIPVLKKFRNG